MLIKEAEIPGVCYPTLLRCTLRLPHANCTFWSMWGFFFARIFHSFYVHSSQRNVFSAEVLCCALLSDVPGFEVAPGPCAGSTQLCQLSLLLWRCTHRRLQHLFKQKAAKRGRSITIAHARVNTAINRSSRLTPFLCSLGV